MAQIGDGNIVLNITVAQDDWNCEGFIEYNDSNPAGIGYTYDSINNVFISPKPECGHDSLLLNNSSLWECAECEAIFLEAYSM